MIAVIYDSRISRRKIVHIERGENTISYYYADGGGKTIDRRCSNVSTFCHNFYNMLDTEKELPKDLSQTSKKKKNTPPIRYISRSKRTLEYKEGPIR